MESSSRPIITLQVGNYSNHIGAHMFNSQMNYFHSDPEADKSIFWKSSLLPNRQRILTPRALLFDLDANWPRRGNISEVGELERTEAGWEGAVNRVIDTTLDKKEPPGSIPGRWSDYLDWKVEGMGKVCFPISNFTYNSSTGVLSNYEQGEEIYLSLQEGVVDGIRRYAEDCDYLEGFHILFDQDDGFGGIANGILSHLNDEYEKKCRLSIGVSPATRSRWADETRSDSKSRLMNTALAWSSCNSHSSLFTSLSLCNNLFFPFPQPRRLPLLNYNGSSDYESSAILAAALDTIIAPYFSRTQPTGLSDMIGLLNAYGRRMTTFGASFPLDVGDKSLFGTLKEHGADILQNLSPGTGSSSESSLNCDTALGNYFVIRGVPKDKVMRQNEETPALRLETSGSCLEFFSREFCSKSLNVIRSIQSQFNVSHPFPSQVVEQTFLTTQAKTKFRGKDCWSVGVLATAHNSTSPKHVLQRLISEVDLPQVRDSFPQRHLEEEDYKERLEALKSLREAYLPEYS